MEFLTLDVSGMVIAVAFGVLFVLLGFGLGAFFVVSMIVFLVLSAAVTYAGEKYKKKIGLKQKPRGIRNVLANGLPPIIMVLFFYAFNLTGNGTLALLSAIGFLASVAGITADKFSSEIGMLNGTPRMILTGKKVRKGTSGGVSALGMFAGLVGAFLISSLVMLAVGQYNLFKSTYVFGIRKAIIAVTSAGLIGSLVDSVLGYFEEKGIGNKFTSNFICGVTAGFVAMLIFAVI